MPSTSALDERALERMVAVGRTGPDRVRLWFRAPRPGLYQVEIRSASDRRRVRTRVEAAGASDGTHAFTYPTDFPGEPPLAPMRRYRFRVTARDGTRVGSGRFETAPAGPADTPGRFSFGVVSCHQPFTERGTVAPEARRMLRLARRRFREHDVKAVLMCGDQMYADAPRLFDLRAPAVLGEKLDGPGAGPRFLTELEPAEVRRLYQERYRVSWHLPELQRLYADFPSYPILDDHEIVDDWGSLPGHAHGHARLLRGAREAYLDYQGSRVLEPRRGLPRSFHYSVDYGHTAVFFFDLRSERRVGGEVISEAQVAAFERFLVDHDEARVLVVVSSVPLVHLPAFLADAGHLVTGPSVDFVDHWSLAANRPTRDRLLTRLYEQGRRRPRQRIVLVGGDVHLGALFRIEWADGTPPIHQFTSSALTNPLSELASWVSGLAPSLSMRLEAGPGARAALLKQRREEPNPFRGLNAGILEIADDPEVEGRSLLRFKLVGFRPWERDAPEELFDSGAL